ncbi:MAG TPA: electron transfer flavoprotein subunit beta/FixA family protein, partial [Acidimicrobiia bacterium]|nr:electron transfer flavoprotein subunit beta/FixA family protein [Acidimicrobiia bacterium]
MDIVVLLRPVPDPVEELELNDDGSDLDRDYLGYVLNEFDDHALEEAVLLKEDAGGTVTVLGLGSADEMEQILYTALAKGADEAIQLGEDLEHLSVSSQAELFSSALEGRSYDLILTGVQAADELDGQLGVRVAAKLGIPHVSVVVGVAGSNGAVRVTKEFWGGITADYQVRLPAVVGIQAARQAPRYVAVSLIRQAQQGGNLSQSDVDPPEDTSGIRVVAMRVPESGEGAEL